MRCKRISWLSVLGVGSVTLLSADALAADPCTGHTAAHAPAGVELVRVARRGGRAHENHLLRTGEEAAEKIMGYLESDS